MYKNMLQRISPWLHASQFAQFKITKERRRMAPAAARPIAAESLEQRMMLSGYSLSTLESFATRTT